MSEYNIYIDCNSINEINTRKQKLALQYHSDKGGTDEQMMKINSDADKMKAYLEIQDQLNELGLNRTAPPVKKPLGAILADGFKKAVEVAETVKPLVPVAMEMYDTYKSAKQAVEPPQKVQYDFD